MNIGFGVFSDTKQNMKKVSTVEELPQYMLACIYKNNMAEESEEARQEKMEKIMRKLKAGKKLTKEELAWLRQNDPVAYAHAVRVQMIAEETEKELKAAKTKDEADRILSSAVSGLSEDDPDKEYIVAAVSRVSKEFHQSGAYSRLPATPEEAARHKNHTSKTVFPKEEEQEDELQDWSPLNEIIEKLPTFTAGA